MLLGFAVLVRVPGTIYGGYLVALLLLILGWGLCFERSFPRLTLGAFLGAVAATCVAFMGMLLPNERLTQFCNQPHVYCEDFSAALLIYGTPFVLAGVPALTAVVHGLSLALGHVLRRRR